MFRKIRNIYKYCVNVYIVGYPDIEGASERLKLISLKYIGKRLVIRYSDTRKVVHERILNKESFEEIIRRFDGDDTSLIYSTIWLYKRKVTQL
jgi:hypothetical protein